MKNETGTILGTNAVCHCLIITRWIPDIPEKKNESTDTTDTRALWWENMFFWNDVHVYSLLNQTLVHQYIVINSLMKQIFPLFF